MERKIISNLFNKHSKTTTVAVIILILLAFLIGAYVAFHTTSEYSHITYCALIKTERTENFTVYLPLPNLSSKDIDILIRNFQPKNRTEFNNFLPYINMGYNESKISVIESIHGKMLKVSANGSVLFYSNIQTDLETASTFISMDKTDIFLNKTESQSNITIKLFVFKETPKEGFFEFNYNHVEFCGLSLLQPSDIERFTYLSELRFLDESEETVLKNGWNEYFVYKGTFDMCMD